MAACVGFAAWTRLRGLTETPEPTGVDGYWYLLQVRACLEHGALPSSLVPLLMAAAARVCGTVAGVKLVAALGTAAAAWPAYVLAHRLSGERAPALVAATLVATSAQSFYLSTEFIKQGVGLTLALASLAALLAALEQPTRLRWLAVALLGVATALAHRSALALVLVLAAPTVAQRFGGVALMATAAIEVAVAAVAAWRYHLIATPAHFALPVLAGEPPLMLGREVALAAALAALLLASALIRRRWPHLLAVTAALLALALALPWLSVSDEQGLGLRLRLCAWTTLAPCAAALVVAIPLRPQRRAGVALLLAVAVAIVRPWHSDEGVVRPHPLLVDAVKRLAGRTEPGAIVVVPERHIVFMAAWYARVDARLQPPATATAAPLYRLLPGAEIKPALWAALDELRAHPSPTLAPPVALHTLHPNGLVLLREATFQYLVASLPEPERSFYRRWHVQ